MFVVVTGIRDYEYVAGVFNDLDFAKECVEKAARERFPSGNYSWFESNGSWFFSSPYDPNARADDFHITEHQDGYLVLDEDGINA